VTDGQAAPKVPFVIRHSSFVIAKAPAGTLRPSSFHFCVLCVICGQIRSAGFTPVLTSTANPCFIPRMAPASNELLTDLLRDVSRSFYLTLRVLPKSIRSQIGLAYLLARTTDTIADTEIISVEQRLQSLRALRDRIAGTGAAPLNFGELARNQSSPAERVLLEKCDASLALLESLNPDDRQRIRTSQGRAADCPGHR
jgi:hypothetical protein